MSAADPFALGGTDPLIALGAEWDALTVRIEAVPDDDDADKLVDRAIVIEDRIAELVPRSAAGAAVQLRLLRHWQRDLEWAESAEKLVDKMLAGLRQLDKGDW